MPKKTSHQVVLNLDLELFEQSEAVRKELHFQNRNEFWRVIMGKYLAHFRKKQGFSPKNSEKDENV